MTNDMACSSSVIFRWRQLIRAPQVAQRIEEGLISLLRSRSSTRALSQAPRTCAAQPPPGDRRVIVGEDLDEGDRVLIRTRQWQPRSSYRSERHGSYQRLSPDIPTPQSVRIS